MCIDETTEQQPFSEFKKQEGKQSIATVSFIYDRNSCRRKFERPRILYFQIKLNLDSIQGKTAGSFFGFREILKLNRSFLRLMYDSANAMSASSSISTWKGRESLARLPFIFYSSLQYSQEMDGRVDRIRRYRDDQKSPSKISLTQLKSHVNYHKLLPTSKYVFDLGSKLFLLLAGIGVWERMSARGENRFEFRRSPSPRDAKPCNARAENEIMAKLSLAQWRLVPAPSRCNNTQRRYVSMFFLVTCKIIIMQTLN